MNNHSFNYKVPGNILSREEMRKIMGGEVTTQSCNEEACYVVGTNEYDCKSGGGYLSNCVQVEDRCSHTTCFPGVEYLP